MKCLAIRNHQFVCGFARRIIPFIDSVYFDKICMVLELLQPWFFWSCSREQNLSVLLLTFYLVSISLRCSVDGGAYCGAKVASTKGGDGAGS